MSKSKYIRAQLCSWSILLFATIVVAFFVLCNLDALAESVGVTSSVSELDAAINEQVNFVVSTTQDHGGATADTYITVADNDAGGKFYTGTIAGACNSINPDSDSRFAIINNKGVCYANSSAGEHQITITLFNGDDVQIGEQLNVRVNVIDQAPAINIVNFATVHNPDYSGINVRFSIMNVGNLDNLSTVIAELFKADDLLTTNTGTLDLISRVEAGQSSFETTFFMAESSSDQDDDLWSHQAVVFDQNTVPVKVAITLTDANDSYLASAENLDESTITYLEILSDLSTNNQVQIDSGVSNSAGGAIMTAKTEAAPSVLGVTINKRTVINDGFSANQRVGEEEVIKVGPKAKVLQYIFKGNYSIEVKINLMRVYKTFMIRQDSFIVS